VSGQDDPSAAKRVDSPDGWVVVLATMFCLTFGPSALLVSGFGVFVHPLAETFGWNVGQVGFAVSLLALTLVAVSPLQGFLIDRYGARTVILASIPALSAGLMGMKYLPANIGVFYLYWVMLTILAVGAWPASYLRAVSSWFDRHLGLATGVANAGIGFGVIVVPPIAAALIASVGWRWAFVGLGSLALITLPVAALFIREAGGPARVPDGTHGSMVPVRILFGNANFRRVVLGYFLVGITGTGIVAGLVPLLIAGGMTRGSAIAVMSLFGVAALVGRVLTGWLLDQLPVSFVMNTFVVLSAVATAGYAHGIGGSAAVVAAVFLGLLMGAEFDVLAYAIRRYFGLPLFGRIYGVAFGAFQLGAALGAGALAVSVQRTQSYRVGMGIFTAALLISIPVFGSLGPYPRLKRIGDKSR
jgi:MFS family permease